MMISEGWRRGYEVTSGNPFVGRFGWGEVPGKKKVGRCTVKRLRIHDSEFIDQ